MQYEVKLSSFAQERGYTLWYDLYSSAACPEIRVYYFLKDGTPVLERNDGNLKMIVPRSKEQAEEYIRKIS